MNIRMDEVDFARNAQGIGKKYHEVLLLMKCLQTTPEVKNLIINFYDIYYTVIKNRNEKKSLDNQYENDYIKFKDILPNH